jgi:hypothetical protein
VLKCTDIYISQKIIASLIAKRSLSRQAELSFISKLLTSSEKDIPPTQVNLLDLWLMDSHINQVTLVYGWWHAAPLPYPILLLEVSVTACSARIPTASTIPWPSLSLFVSLIAVVCVVPKILPIQLFYISDYSIWPCPCSRIWWHIHSNYTACTRGYICSLLLSFVYLLRKIQSKVLIVLKPKG